VLNGVNILGSPEKLRVYAYIDALPWVLGAPREDESLWSVEGCAVSDFSHFVRVRLVAMLAL
jgi:hypothetical protein